MKNLTNTTQVIVQNWSLTSVDSDDTGSYECDKFWRNHEKDDRTDVQHKIWNSGEKQGLMMEHCNDNATVVRNLKCRNTVQTNVLYRVVKRGIWSNCALFQEFRIQSGVETFRLMNEPSVMIVISGNIS